MAGIGAVDPAMLADINLCSLATSAYSWPNGPAVYPGAPGSEFNSFKEFLLKPSLSDDLSAMKLRGRRAGVPAGATGIPAILCRELEFAQISVCLIFAAALTASANADLKTLN